MKLFISNTSCLSLLRTLNQIQFITKLSIIFKLKDLEKIYFYERRMQGHDSNNISLGCLLSKNLRGLCLAPGWYFRSGKHSLYLIFCRMKTQREQFLNRFNKKECCSCFDLCRHFGIFSFYGNRKLPFWYIIYYTIFGIFKR